jgi:general secretion pathway protein F
VSVVDCNLIKENPISEYPQIEKTDRPQQDDNPGRQDFFRRISTKDLCTMVRQLATLLHAGMPLVPALAVLVEQIENVCSDPLTRSRSQLYLAEKMKNVLERVNAGNSFADALEEQGDFSPLFINMVAAGQAGGNLEEVLEYLAQMLEKRVKLTGKVKAAIAYPATMIVVAISVVVFLLSFVVPSITEIFVEMNQTLPWPTQLLISTSAFLKSYLIAIIVILCAAVIGAKIWLQKKEARLIADRAKLRLPLFGRLLLKLETARLARTLGVLMLSGIPILNALDIAKGIVRNSFIAQLLDSVREHVSKGQSLSEAIRKTSLFGPIVYHLIATGQMSGRIEEGLLSIAQMYEDQVENTSQTLTSLLEPAILLAMGAIIGFIVLAILLPIFEINQMI